MKFAKWVFTLSGLYGLLLIAPLYFGEAQLGQQYAPAITHPEYYYGFLGVGIACQVMFLIIGRDPARYRALMFPAMNEKFSYGIAATALYLQGRLHPVLYFFPVIDIMLGLLFVAAYIATAEKQSVAPERKPVAALK